MPMTRYVIVEHIVSHTSTFFISNDSVALAQIRRPADTGQGLLCGPGDRTSGAFEQLDWDCRLGSITASARS